MAGAEGHARFDAHGNDAVRHLARIVRAIDEEASRAHGRQAFLAQLDPVEIGQQRHMHGATCKFLEQIAVRHLRIQRFDGRIIAERFLADEHGLRMRRGQFEQGGEIGGIRFRRDDRGFPKGRSVHARVTKLSITRLVPALSKSTVSLLPSTAVTRP
jgi:hypothetical protein